MMRIVHDAENDARSDIRVRKALEMFRTLEDKLARGLGVTRSARLSSLCDDLADLAVEGERVAEIVRGIPVSGDSKNSLANAFGELDAQCTHIAWHVRSLRRNLQWVHHLLDKQGTPEDDALA